MAQHELRPLESAPPEKFFIMRDYAQFKRDFPIRLRAHLDEIKAVVERLEQIYTEAEVN